MAFARRVGFSLQVMMRLEKKLHTKHKKDVPNTPSPKFSITTLLSRGISIIGLTIFLAAIDLLNRYLLPDSTLQQSITVTILISFAATLLLHYFFSKRHKQRSLRLQRQHDELKQAHQDKDKVIEILKEALDEIKTLSGLLPICASCKKIRDDEGYWHQVESFICKHTHAEFTHSLCPDCLEELYPEQKKNM